MKDNTLIIINENSKKIEPYNSNGKSVRFNIEDTQKVLIDKIFISSDNYLLPELISLQRKTSSTLQVSNLVNHVKFVDLLSNIQDSVNSRSVFFNGQYNTLKKVFTLLTKHVLINVNKIVLYENIPDIVSDFKQSITDFLYESSELKKELILKYVQKTITVSPSKIGMYIETFPNGSMYSVKTCIIKIVFGEFQNYSSENIHQIIRNYPLLNNRLPLMYLFEKGKIVRRVYSKFPKEQIDEWLYKNNPKGLTLKFLNKRNEYITASLSRNKPSISIRLNLVDKNLKYDEIISEIGTIDTIVTNFQKILNIQNYTPIKQITYLNIGLKIKKWIDLFTLNKTVKSNFQGILKVEDNSKSLKLKYFTDNLYTPIIIIIHNDENIEIKGDKKHITKINVVNISGATKEYQIQNTINVILKLFIIADSFQQGTSSVPVIKDVQNIKKLNKIGLSINSTLCQKKRLPTIISDDVTTDVLKFKGLTLRCKNPDYPFTGFTGDNKPCCFKKNQTQKIVYIRNTTNDYDAKILTDSYIIKQPVIITNKILEPNRLGVLPELLSPLFPHTSFLRLGNAHESFIHCIKLAFPNIVSIIKNGLTLSLFRSLNNGKLYNKYDFNDYKKLVSSSNSQHGLVVDLLSHLLKTNIFIFDVTTLLICDSIYSKKYKDTIFIIHHSGHYELIVKASKVKLMKVFPSKDTYTIKIINMYNNLCKVLYTPYNGDILVTPNTIKQLPDNIRPFSQVVLNNNKITYIGTQYGIIPVAPSGPLPDVPFSKIKDLILPAKKQRNLLLKSGLKYANVIGQIQDNGETIGLVTECGVIVPTKNSLTLVGIPILNQQFFYDSDNALLSGTVSSDKRSNYAIDIAFTRELYQRFRFLLSNIIPVYKEQILDIMSRTQKIDNLKNIIITLLKNYITLGTTSYITTKLPEKRQLCTDSMSQQNPFCKNGRLYIMKSDYEPLVLKVVYSIVNETKQGLQILNGAVPENFLNSNNFVFRTSESVVV